MAQLPMKKSGVDTEKGARASFRFSPICTTGKMNAESGRCNDGRGLLHHVPDIPGILALDVAVHGVLAIGIERLAIVCPLLLAVLARN